MPEDIKIYNREGRPLTEEELAYLEALIDRNLVEVIRTAEGFAVRSYLVGRILADLAERGMTAEQIELEAMPLTLKVLVEKIGPLSRQDIYAIQFAKQRAADNITDMTNRVKSEIREVIRSGIEQRKNPLTVASDLFDRFGNYNRDWRRVAITESTRAAGEGYMRRLFEDQKIMGRTETLLIGQSAVDACPWCKENIHGKVFKLISKDEAPVDNPDSPLWDTALWPGKDNMGRGYTKRKWVVQRDGSKVLVPRPNSELAKPAFAAHPNCRCWYMPYLRKFKIGADGFLE